jgi:hypothetical protein
VSLTKLTKEDEAVIQWGIYVAFALGVAIGWIARAL